MPEKNILADNNLDINKGLELSQESAGSERQDFFNKPVVPVEQLPSLNIQDDKFDLKSATSSLEDKFSQSKYKPNPWDEGSVTENTVPKEAKDKFSKGYFPGLDNEDIYGRSQSGLEKAAYTVPRVIGTATKTLLQGLTAPVVGLGYLAAGGNFIKNDYNDWLESYDKMVDKNLPLYTTEAEKNSSFLGQIKYGNSWVHLAEFIGMGAGLAGTAWLTGGLGEGLGIGTGTKVTASYLNAIDKLAESTSIISKLENSEEVGTTLIQKANQIWSQTIPEAEKLEQLTASFDEINATYASKMATIQGAKGKVYGAASMLGMNAGMASQANTQFAESMIQEIESKEGREATPEEKQKIKEMASTVGQWTFGLGTVMSAFSFHGLLKGMIGKDAEKVVLDETNNIINKESVNGAVQYGEKKLPFEVGATDNKALKSAKWAGNKIYQGGKFAGKLVDPWAGIGLAEFSLMGPSVENYYKKKYDTGKADLIEDALGPNVDKLFTKEGMSTFFLGMIGSAPFEAGRKFKEQKEKGLNTKNAISKFNDVTAKTFLNENMNSIIRDKSLNTDEQTVIANQDDFSKYNIREQRLINYLFPRVKFGMRNLVTKELKTYRDQLSTPEGVATLQKEFNIEGKPEEAKAQLTKYLDHMEDMADKMEKNYKAVSMRYGKTNGFSDSHIEKLLYLSQMTDNATERVKTLAEELRGDKRLQDSFLNTAVNKDNGGFSTYNPTTDITRLLTAESRNTVVRNEEGEKKIKAHEIYDGIIAKIDGLLIDDTQKEELRNKVNDLVRLNSSRRDYLKEYHDITNNPKKYNTDRKFSMINPYTENYGEDYDYALKNTLNPRIGGIETKTGAKDIELGEEYYSGSPIKAISNGQEIGFRKFKIIREIKEGEDAGKLLIKTEKGDILPVEKDFLKKHDIGQTKSMTKRAKFYDRNKFKRVVRESKDKTKETKTEVIETKQASLEEEREWAINSSEEAHKDSYAKLEEDWKKLQSQPSSKQKDTDIEDIRKKMLEAKNSLEDEHFRIHKYYDAEQKRLEDLKKELNISIPDLKNRLDNKARIAFAKASNAIDNDYNEGLKKKKEQLAQGNNIDLDFEKSKLEDKRQKQLEDLRKEYRDLYDKKLEELQKANTETGILEYSPTDNKLKFVTQDNKEEDINVEEFANGKVTKMDGSSWSEEDKDFFKNGDKEEDNRKVEEILKAKAENIEKELDLVDKNSYWEPGKASYEVDAPDTVKETAQSKANEAIQKATGKPSGQKGAKKPINRAIRSSIVLDTQFLISKYPSLKTWLESRNRWAERANTFLSKISDTSKINFWKNTDLKYKNGNYQQPTVLFIHSGNQEKLGLKGFITEADLTNAAEKRKTNSNYPDPVYMILVHTDKDNKKWTIDNNGKKLKEVGTEHTEEDYSSMIYTARPSDLKWEDGTNSFQDTSAEDVDKYTKQFHEENKLIFNSTAENPIEHVFEISNGFIDKPVGGKKRTTPLSKTGLVDNNNLAYPMVQISTLGGKGIFIGDKEVMVPTGIPFWVRGSSVQVLDSKRFTPKNVSVIYKCLEWLASTSALADVESGKEDPDAVRKSKKYNVQKFLSSVIFFNNRPEAKDPNAKTIEYTVDSEGFPKNRYDNQVSILVNRRTNLPYLMLGNKERIPFTPDALEANKEKITAFIEGLHHVVLSQELLKAKRGDANLTYYEVTGFDDKNLPITKEWSNYTEYLTSSEGRDNTEVPLTVNSDESVNGKPNLSGVYITTGNGQVSKEVLDKPNHEPKKYEPINATKTESTNTDKTSVESPSSIKVTFPIGDKTTDDLVTDGKTENVLISKIQGAGDIHYTVEIVDNKPVIDILQLNNTLAGELSKEVVESIGGTYDPKPEENWNTMAATIKNFLTKNIQAELDKQTVEPVKEVPKEEIKVPVTDIEAKREEIRQRRDQELEGRRPGDGWGSTSWDTIYNRYDAELKALEQQPETKIEEIKPSENPVQANENAEAVASAMRKRQNKRPSGDRDNVIKNMSISELEKGAKLENVQAFKDWMEKVLPGFLVSDLPYMLRNSAGGYSWGQYNDAYKTISLGLGAIEGTGFHEAFHAVFDSYLSPKEQRAILNEFKNKKGEYTNRFGETKKYSDLHTDLEIMEQLADEFREHNITGKVFEEPVKMSFFMKLKKFIKDFFGLGTTVTQKDLFNKINAGYFKDAKFFDRKFAPVRDMIQFKDGTSITTQTGRALFEGVIGKIHKYLGIDNGGLAAITDGKIDVKKLLNNIKEDINEQLMYPDEKFSQGQLDGFAKTMQPLVKQYEDEYGPYYQLDDEKWDYLVENKIKEKLATLGLKIVPGNEWLDLQNTEEEVGDNVSSVPETASTDEVTKNTNKQVWGGETLKIDAKATSPKEIQFLFNTIFKCITDSVPSNNKNLEDPQYDYNAMLFNTVVEDNSLFYQNMSALSYCGTLQEMDDAMKDLATRVPSLVPTYKYLFGVEAANRTPQHWDLLTKFFKTFSKYAPESIMQRRDEAGNNFTTSANSDGLVTHLQNNWETNFKSKKAAYYNPQTKTFTVAPGAKFTEPTTTKKRFEFLEEIGFTGLDQERYEDYVNSNPKSDLTKGFSELVKTIYSNVLNAQKNQYPILGKDIFGAGTSIRKLAEIVANMTIDKYASQYQRLDKEFVQTNINQNFYARLLGSVRKALNLEDFLNKNPRLKNDVGVKNSLLLKEGNQFFDKEGKPKKISMILDNGIVDENNNRVLLSEMTGSQRMLYTLNGLLFGRKENGGKGIFQMAAPADQSSDFGMEIEHYIPVSAFKDSGIKKYQGIFKGYLEDEINMIKDFKNPNQSKNRADYEELAKVVNGSPRGEQLRYFKDVFGKNPDLVKLVTDYANGKGSLASLSYEEFFKTVEGKFNIEVEKFLNKMVEDHLATLHRESAIVRVNDVYSKFKGLNTDFLKEWGQSRRKINEVEDYFYTDAELKEILSFANSNYQIHNIELSKLFYGDPANYKDFLKRAKMYNSGTERNFHSDEFNLHFNKEFNKAKTGDTEVELEEGDYGYRKASHNMKGMTYDYGDTDKKTTVVSKSIEFIKKHIGNKAAKQYEDKNNPIDAQSHATIDAAREFAIKAGTWTTKHEELFQLKKAQERLRLEERLKDKEKNPDLARILGRERIYSEDVHGKELKHADEQIVNELSKKIDNNPEYAALFNVKKYLGAGFSGNEDFNVPNGLKTSTMELFGNEAIENTPLEELYFFMQKNGIDYIGPKSQQKFGRINKAKNLYHIDSNYDSVGKLALHDLSPEEVQKQTYEQPLENYNKIVETAGQHDEGTIGTQLRVQATVDMMNAGLPGDWYDSSKNFFQQKAEWDNLSEEQKRSDSDLYRIHSDMNNCLKGMIKQGEPIIYKKLGVSNKNGKYEVSNPEKLLKFLKQMTNLYNLPANLKDAIRITKDENGKDVINIDQLANRQSLEYIINSLIEKHVIRPKINGGPKILISGELWEKNGRNAVAKNEDGTWTTLDTKEKFDAAKAAGQRIQLTSNELKFYREGENGEILGMEIKVNNHFKEKMYKWATKNNKEIASDEELLKYLNSDAGRKLLEGVGFRIPSQGLNSFDVLKIVGFTDDSLGGVVVVPSEITTKVGSDFDVDKLNTYLKNFYIDKETGLPKRVEFFEDTNSEEVLEKIWEQHKAMEDTQLEDLTKEAFIELGKNIEDVTKVEFDDLKKIMKDSQTEIESINEFIKNNKGKDPYLVNAREAIDNKYFELLAESIIHESNLEKLLTPNSTEFLEEVEAEMDKIDPKADAKREKGDINYTDFLNMQWVNQKRQEVLEAKNATSVSANAVTSHAMMQSFPFYLNPKIQIKLPHQKIEVEKGVFATSLAGTINKVKQPISEILSQLVNTTVDAVNNPILMKLLPSIDVFSQALFLIRSGVDPMHTFFFLKQPIIQDYVREKKKNNSKSEDGKGADKKVKLSVLKNRIINNYKGGDEVSIDQLELTNEKGTGLKDILASYNKDYGSVKKMSESKRAMQRAILEEFLKYDSLASEMFEQQSGSYWGNVRKATYNNTYLKNRVYDRAGKNDNFIGLQDNFDKSWFGTLKNTVSDLSTNISSALFKLSAPVVERQTRSAMEFISDLIIKGGVDEKTRMLNNVKTNFMNFATQIFAKDKNGKPLNEEISRLMLGDKSMANRLEDVKNTLEKLEKQYNKEVRKAKKEGTEIPQEPDIIKNSAFRKLTAMISNPKNPRMVGFDSKPNGSNEADDFTTALEELKDHPQYRDFYEDLLKANLIQSGTGSNRNSISSLIPYQDYENYTNQALQAIADNNPLLNVYDKLKVLWRTNYNDDRLVPKRYKTDKFKLESGENVVHLPVVAKSGRMYEHSPVVKIKRPVDVLDKETNKVREANEQELADMRNNNQDFKENLYQNEGYQQVLDNNGQKVIINIGSIENPIYKYLYKSINLWGDGRNMGEFYTDARPSVLDKNIKVNELSDEEFLEKYKKDQKGSHIVNIEDLNKETKETITEEEEDTQTSEPEELGNSEEPSDFYDAMAKAVDDGLITKEMFDEPSSLEKGDEPEQCPF